MSYGLYVVRGEALGDEDKNPITKEEWLSYANNDKSLILKTEEGYSDSDFDWHGHSEQKEPWLIYWLSGKVHSQAGSADDSDVILKLCDIAKKFKANVIGDEGEKYCKEPLLDMPDNLPPEMLEMIKKAHGIE